MTALSLVVRLIFLLLASGCRLGLAATIAVSSRTNTVCAIMSSSGTVRCAQIRGIGGFNMFNVSPPVKFESISGGRDYFCGMSTGGNALFCWNPMDQIGLGFKRVYYRESTVLKEISVGNSHVAAVRSDSTIEFWRGREFPETVVVGNYTSLTSGDGFSCAIGNRDGKVHCWGKIGNRLARNFEKVSMNTIVAGESWLCGINTTGYLVCNDKFGGLVSPSDSTPFEFLSLTLDRGNICAIRRVDNSVVCWENGIRYRTPMGNSSVEVIVSGGDLSCALRSSDLQVICWRSRGSIPFALPFRGILPGPCVANSSCSCGEFPGSIRLCPGSSVVCRICSPRLHQLPPSPLLPPAMPQLPPSPLLPLTPPSSLPQWKRNRYLAFLIVGSIGTFLGICTVMYWILIIACRHKRVHHSVPPATTNTDTNTNADIESNPPQTTAASNPSKIQSKPSFFRRQKSQLSSAIHSNSESNSGKLRSKSSFFRRQRSGPSSSILIDRAIEFTFEELSTATANFSTILGGGSFGTVYKGKLPDNREVAIKRSHTTTNPISKRLQEKEDAFDSELEFLSRLHHKHLVGLVGFSDETPNERLLVYEYMPNGSLHDHLHTTTPTPLDSWKIRIQILLDASRGIDYLHNYAVPPVIHRDIKSSNILLDSDWSAKVSDFGLSLTGSGSDNPNLKTAGTLGYMDPEYYGLHHLTSKSDVYGLGVVMLEVLTGKKAIFKDGDGVPTSVVVYAVGVVGDGGLREVLDRRVRVEGRGVLEAVEIVAAMAVECVRLVGRERPRIRDVVVGLENAVAVCEEAEEGGWSGRSDSLVSCDF